MTKSETSDVALSAANERTANSVLAYRHFEQFVRANAPNDPYHWGRHTYAIAEACQKATEAVEAGECYYAIVTVGPRHGKSDLVSRRWPVWHMLRNPRHEIMLTTYSGNLATDLSYDARECFRENAPQYGISLSEDRASLAAWNTNMGGKVYAVGLYGTITGRGAHILVIDDFVKNEEEAASLLIRDKGWKAFRHDLTTRLAPAHAILICCTRWHEDDIVGRIFNETDPDFPTFELFKFPALNEDTGEWLFPERFSDAFYRMQRATKGGDRGYGWQAIYQCDPRPREGNQLNATTCDFYEEAVEGCVWVRGWDLASTTKERMREDPDYTVGTRLGLKVIDGLTHLYVDDQIRGRWTGLQRQATIKAAAESDGEEVAQAIETGGTYKEAYEELKRAIGHQFVVKKVRPVHDLVTRATPLEPLFDSGRVHVRKAAWNAEWLEEVLAFPLASHDDQVAGLCTAHDALRKRAKIYLDTDAPAATEEEMETAQAAHLHPDNDDLFSSLGLRDLGMDW